MAEEGSRLSDIMALAAEALESLDVAVGRAARLPVSDRDRVREYLLPPRNHLRSSLDTLRQKIEEEEARAAAPRWS